MEEIEGTVKNWFDNKGFGFVIGDDGAEYFIHISKIINQSPLSVGDRISFIPKSGDRGLLAVDVEKLE
jgi:CspA family cold shock protein